LLPLYSLLPESEEHKPEERVVEVNSSKEETTDQKLIEEEQNTITQQEVMEPEETIENTYDNIEDLLQNDPDANAAVNLLGNIVNSFYQRSTGEGMDEGMAEFPFPNPEGLQMLMMMGFPQWRSQKALLLNMLDPQLAIEWLLQHLDDPTVDDPLTPEHNRQLISLLAQNQIGFGASNDDEEEEDDDVAEKIQECVRNGKCTYTITGKDYKPQKWYYCYTCGFVDREGVCEGCANVCHKGHKLSEAKDATTGSSGFYCDCGAGSSCKCNK